MTERTPEPNTDQITVWRNLLDAFGQLSAAWEAAGQAQRASEAGSGPGAMQMPESLVNSFARAGEEAADTLTGVATVLSNQQGATRTFAEVARSQSAARDQWTAAHESLASSEPAEE